MLYKEKNRKNVHKKRKNENFNNKKCVSFSCLRDYSTKNSLLTDRFTHTKVNTEDTLSGFQEFFIQPIMKNRSNNKHNAELQQKPRPANQLDIFYTRFVIGHGIIIYHNFKSIRLSRKSDTQAQRRAAAGRSWHKSRGVIHHSTFIGPIKHIRKF